MRIILAGSAITSHTQNPGSGGGSTDARDEQSVAYFDGIISDNESVCGSLTNPTGITRKKGGERLEVEQTVVTVVTERRIVFTTPKEKSAGAVSLEYDEITATSLEDNCLELMTADGIGLEWQITQETEATDGIINHLCWIGTVRSEIKRCQNDIDLTAGEIRDSAASLDWEDAKTAYQQARDQLDETFNLVFVTTPVDNGALAPELTETERTLEETHTRLYIEQAQSQLDLGRQLVENGDYIQGRKVLQQAQECYARAQEQKDAVERGDAFQFGTQRELTEDLESLGWKIETVAAEPIKQAHEAKIEAQTTTEPTKKLTHWETAFKRYGHVLTLEWGNRERNFAGDPKEVEAELKQAADRLIDLHNEVATDRWNEGGQLQKEGEPKNALRACLDAQEHLERAHELAAEFDPARAEALGSRLEKMADAVMRMRNADTSDDVEKSTADSTTEEANTEEAGGESEETETEPQADEKTPKLPSASELAEIDTHHELTLNAEGLQVSENTTETDPLETETKKRRKGRLTDGETTRH